MWLKLTDEALYLMQSGTDSYVSKASLNNGRLHVPPDWFTRDNAPKSLILDLDASEPKPSVTPPSKEKAIDWYDFNCRVSRHFTVGKVVHWDIKRVPKSVIHMAHIMKMCLELDKIRDEWGSAIGVSSFYRPEPYNSQVGGVSNSLHIPGMAADIFPMNGEKAQFENWLDDHWYGCLGYGQRSGRGFTHLDNRNKKGWRTGGNKGVRWYY